MGVTLTKAQARALRALANTNKAGGEEAAGAIKARGSTMSALVAKGFATRRHVVCDLVVYKITDAGRAALAH